MRRTSALAILILLTILLNACAFGGGPAAPDDLGADVTPGSTGTGATVTSPTSASAGTEAGTEPPAEEQQVTISFAASEDDRALYEPLIEDFEAENANIKVQFVSFDLLLKQFASSEGAVSNDEEALPDIVRAADTVRLSASDEAIRQGLINDLTPFINADTAFNQEDFYPGALVPTGPQQGIYTLPHTLFVPLLSYNKTLWAARNLPEPTAAMTWDDLLAAAQQLTQKNGDTVDVYGLLDWDTGLTLLRHDLTAAGVDLANLQRMDQPEISAAVEHVVEQAKAGVIYAPPAAVANPELYLKTIIGQQVAIWASDMLISPRGLSFEVGTMPFPEGRVGGDGYVMSSGTRYPEQSWRWLSFLSQKEIRQASRSLNLVNQVPARKSIAEQSGYWNQVDEATKTIINTLLDQAGTASTTGLDLRRELLLRQAVEGVLYSGQSTREALLAAQTSLDQQLALEPAQPTAASSVVVVATPAPEAQPGATTIAFGVPRALVDDTRRLANTFNADNPSIFVEIKSINAPALPLTELAGTTDCFASVVPPDQDSLGSLLDIQPLIDADAGFPIDEYPPILLQPFKSQGGQYGLPYSVDLRVLNYNKSAFDAAGLSYPTPSWTMDDFLNAAQTLTTGTDANKQYGFAGGQAGEVFFFLERAGASATTGSGTSLKPNYTDPKVLQALQSYVDLLLKNSPHTRLEGYTTADTGNITLQLAANGRVGMWFDFGTNFFGFRQGGYQGFTRALAPPPLSGGAVTSNDFPETGLYISANAAQPQACWTWLKHLTGVLAGLGGGFPGRMALVDTDEFAKQAPEGALEVATAYRAAFDRAPSPAEQVDDSAINYFWLFRAVDRALQGKDLARELTDAQALTEQYLTCVQAGTFGSDCATQVDPDFQE